MATLADSLVFQERSQVELVLEWRVESEAMEWAPMESVEEAESGWLVARPAEALQGPWVELQVRELAELPVEPWAEGKKLAEELKSKCFPVAESSVELRAELWVELSAELSAELWVELSAELSAELWVVERAEGKKLTEVPE